MTPGIRRNFFSRLELQHMDGIEESAKGQLLQLVALQTAPEHRKQGHATSLLNAVCKEADEAKVILVLSPESDDKLLREWYAKFGFEAIQFKPVVLMCRDPKVQRYDIETDTLHDVV